MNYKQKYEEAIERCKSWIRGEHPECFTEAQKAGEFIFPELRESEDERIRKAQLDYWRSVGGKEWYGVPVQETIAWLEKQDEQKPVWSEGDERMLEEVCSSIEYAETHRTTCSEKLAKSQLDWLKSLKPNNWKPSDLQLEALESAYKQLPNIQHFLQSLYNDLKKL